MGTKHVVPRAEGQGGIGTATLGWGELFITNTTNDSATQGGKLTLTSNDGDAMQSGSRLGVIEFKGAESSSALTIGARIEAICDAVWSATENGASLKFYTTDANASESLVLTLDSNKLAVFSGAVAITGNLTVNGTTTTVNSTIVTIDDPVFTLGGDTAPVSETTQDKGIEFRYHTGSAAKIGFFGWDDSASAFTFIPDATNNSEVFSGTAGNAIFTNITGTLQTAAQTNITSVGALNGGTITSGFGAINNGASTITTTGLISGGSLDISGDADIDGTLETDALSINGTAVTASAADINLIDGITNGTVIASKAIITDSNKDITGGRNITISGTLTTGPFLANGISRVGSNGSGYDFVAYGTTSGKKLNWDSLEDELIIDGDLDVNGDADIDGTLEADAITVNGTALNTVIAGVTVTNATNAATVTGAAQGNITSLGTLTGLSVSGSVNGNYVSTIRNTFSTNSLSFGLKIRAGTNGSDHALRVVNHNESSLLLNVNGNGNLTVGGAATFSSSVTATGGYYYGQTTNSFVRLDNAIGSQIGYNNYAYSLYDSNGVSFYTASNTTPTLKLKIRPSGKMTFDNDYRYIEPAATGDILRISQNYHANGIQIGLDNGTAFDPKLTILRGGMGIGTIAPVQPLQLGDVSVITQDVNSMYVGVNFGGSTNGTYIKSQYANQIHFDSAAGQIKFRMAASGTATNNVSYSTAMRIISTGELLKGITTATGQGTLADYNSTEIGNGYMNLCRDDTATIKQIRFGKNGSEVGSISTTGTATTYNTSSDYRLKENVTPITDALSRVNQLKPSRFNFIAALDNIVDGFIAHEVQDVIPEAISGEKDAINEDGTPDYQGIDQSKIVPLLTAAIQEQQTIIEDLKSRIETLEG